MRTEDAFPSKYLKSGDAKAKPLIATISHMAIETVGQGSEQKKKPILYFEEHKPMVINRTNFDTLCDAFDDSDAWPGHKIRIKCERTQFGGKTVDGLRVEPISGVRRAKPVSTPDNPDEPPIDETMLDREQEL